MPYVILPIWTQDDGSFMTSPLNQNLCAVVDERIIIQQPCDLFASDATLKIGKPFSIEYLALSLSWESCTSIDINSNNSLMFRSSILWILLFQKLFVPIAYKREHQVGVVYTGEEILKDISFDNRVREIMSRHEFELHSNAEVLFNFV